MSGTHAMKFGFQGQVKQNNSMGATGAGPIQLRPRVHPAERISCGNNLGNGIASVLLGYPRLRERRGQYTSLRAATAPQAPCYGWYFQDDFKITPKLTLNSASATT